jgi:DNA ligase (NAD+)
MADETDRATEQAAVLTEAEARVRLDELARVLGAANTAYFQHDAPELSGRGL